MESALLHKYGVFTTLSFSEYASPIFALRKPNGKLSLLVDLRKINNLLSDDYINTNQHISKPTGAAHRMAGKTFFLYIRLFPCISLCTNERPTIFRKARTYNCRQNLCISKTSKMPQQVPVSILNFHARIFRPCHQSRSKSTMCG